MPVYFYGISDFSLNTTNEYYLDEIDLSSQQFLERCGENIYIPQNFPYKNLLKIYHPETCNKLLIAFKSQSPQANFEVYDVHSLESEFYVVSIPKHYDFRIIGINGTRVNSHILKVNVANKRVSFIDYSTYQEREITIRHFIYFNKIFLSFNNFVFATGIPYIYGCVNSLSFNVKKLIPINPIVSFFNSQKSVINNLFLINREDNSIVEYINCNFGNIPIYYPKFLFHRKQNNKVYKYNFTRNVLEEVSNSPITLNQLLSLGHDFEEFYNMNINVITNFFGSDVIEILLNGWIPSLIPIFNYNNKTFVYAKLSSSGMLENLVLGEVF